MTTTAELDREKIPVYNLFIDARDNNFAPENEQRINTRSMQVHLRDINDNAPQFDKALYTKEIKENQDVNDFVIAGIVWTFYIVIVDIVVKPRVVY